MARRGPWSLLVQVLVLLSLLLSDLPSWRWRARGRFLWCGGGGVVWIWASRLVGVGVVVVCGCPSSAHGAPAGAAAGFVEWRTGEWCGAGASGCVWAWAGGRARRAKGGARRRPAFERGRHDVLLWRSGERRRAAAAPGGAGWGLGWTGLGALEFKGCVCVCVCVSSRPARCPKRMHHQKKNKRTCSRRSDL